MKGVVDVEVGRLPYVVRLERFVEAAGVRVDEALDPALVGDVGQEGVEQGKVGARMIARSHVGARMRMAPVAADVLLAHVRDHGLGMRHLDLERGDERVLGFHRHLICLVPDLDPDCVP
jgi:hypothetical protein